MDVKKQPVELAPNTYWVGKRPVNSVFFSNPYLRVYDTPSRLGESFNLLIDPGSSSDVETVSHKLEVVLGKAATIQAFFINHQDPDVGSSLPELTARFSTNALVFASEETWRLIIHIGLVKQRALFTDHYPRGLLLHTGHTLQFVPSPFCHFVGAVMLYDPHTRILFSGDLLGGLTPRNANGLVAGLEDWSGVRAFHQLYMPSGKALQRAIQSIRALDPPVEMIAPQHGRLLKGEVMNEFMHRLTKLPVGIDNFEERHDDATTLSSWNGVLERVVASVLSHTSADALEVIARDHILAEDVRVHGFADFEILRFGKSTLERVIHCVTQGLPEVTANSVRYDAIVAAERQQLPVPKVTLEETLHTKNLDLSDLLFRSH